MSRIATTFDELRHQGRKALIPFITAGDPEPAMMVPLMHELVKAGADIIELGVPFSDPMADGPTIQRSSERALKHHVGLKDVLTISGPHCPGLVHHRGGVKAYFTFDTGLFGF